MPGPPRAKVVRVLCEQGKENSNQDQRWIPRSQQLVEDSGYNISYDSPRRHLSMGNRDRRAIGEFSGSPFQDVRIFFGQNWSKLVKISQARGEFHLIWQSCRPSGTERTRWKRPERRVTECALQVSWGIWCSLPARCLRSASPNFRFGADRRLIMELLYD